MTASQSTRSEQATDVAHQLVLCALRQDVPGIDAVLRGLDPSTVDGVVCALANLAAFYLAGDEPERITEAIQLISLQRAGLL